MRCDPRRRPLGDAPRSRGGHRARGVGWPANYPDTMSTSPVPPLTDPEQVVGVLGLLAASRVTTFGWLATDSARAPDARQRIGFARVAAALLDADDELETATRRHGGDLVVAAEPHLELFAGIGERTRPADWWERLVRTAVAGGMVQDLAGAVAQGLPAALRSRVTPAPEFVEFVVAAMGRVTEGSPALQARLALWGRRVAGEALGTVGPALSTVTVGSGHDLTGLTAPVMATLSAQHARRMERLGLAA